MKDAIHKKFKEDDVSLALKVVRSHADKEKTGGCSLHWDPYDEKKPELSWNLRIIFILFLCLEDG